MNDEGGLLQTQGSVPSADSVRITQLESALAEANKKANALQAELDTTKGKLVAKVTSLELELEKTRGSLNLEVEKIKGRLLVAESCLSAAKDQGATKFKAFSNKNELRDAIISYLYTAGSMGLLSNFNEDISGWDVSGAVKMDGMFANARSFNSDLSRWDVSNVETMQSMFENAYSFDQDLSSWKIPKSANTSNMFSGASKFDLSKFPTEITVLKAAVSP